MEVSSDVIETVIGQATKFKGSVKTDKPISIEGFFEGEIESESTVLVNRSGSFKGKLSCSVLDLLGSVDGKVNCSKLLKMESTGIFKGEAITRDIIIPEGSAFDGNLKISR